MKVDIFAKKALEGIYFYIPDLWISHKPIFNIVGSLKHIISYEFMILMRKNSK